MTQQRILDYYATPAALTAAGKYAARLEQLPDRVEALAGMIQGIAIHEFAASSFYGVEIGEERRFESHIRPAEKMLDRIFELDDRPLTVARPPERRLVGVCRHFMVLLLAMLRAKRIPARGRCGFGAYFNPGYFEDHVVCEYWNATEKRWALADPQFDDVWRARLRIGHDVLDVPRGQFWAPSRAWTECRAGKADPNRFGIAKGGLRGQWFLAVNLIQEVASLNKMELLRWDAWGAMPRPGECLGEDQLAFFDQLAALTREPDTAFDELQRIYERDSRVRVPETVFNSLLGRPERTVSALAV